jgi:hypothetical protein
MVETLHIAEQTGDAFTYCHNAWLRAVRGNSVRALEARGLLKDGRITPAGLAALQAPNAPQGSQSTS